MPRFRLNWTTCKDYTHIVFARDNFDAADAWHAAPAAEWEGEADTVTREITSIERLPEPYEHEQYVKLINALEEAKSLLFDMDDYMREQLGEHVSVDHLSDMIANVPITTEE